MVCQHLIMICNPSGLDRVSRAAEAVLSSSNRPVLGLGRETTLQCLHSGCQFTCSQGAYVCIHCTHVSCRCLATSRHIVDLPSSFANQSASNQPSHIDVHSNAYDHFIFLSAEHMHLYCVRCDDFVFHRHLNAAIAARGRMARANRTRFISSISPLETSLEGVMPLKNAVEDRIRKQRRLLTAKDWIPSRKELHVISKRSRVFCLPETELRPPIGLVNLGNSCYMNSVLQAFLNAPPLRNFFLADEHRAFCERRPRSSCLACAIDRLVCDSCFDEKGSTGKGREGSSSLKVPFLIPRDVLDITWRNAAHLATYAQHDAHEFLIAALNILNTHCRREKAVETGKLEPDLPVLPAEAERENESNEAKFLSTMKSKINPVSPVTNVRAGQNGDLEFDVMSSECSGSSIIQCLFGGTLQSDVICRVCGNSSLTLERFYDISLDVDKFVKASTVRRSRAQSPAARQSGREGNPGNICSAKTTLALSQEMQSGVLVDDKRKGLLTLEDPSTFSKESGETVNGSFECHHARDMNAANSLEECLSRFTEPELLGSSSKMHCMRCGRRQESMKQMSIRTLPPIICFHFKRFEQSFANMRKSEMIKIDTPVEFPADGMDLSKFQTSAVLRSRQGKTARADFAAVHNSVLAKSKMQAASCNIVNENEFEVRSSKEAVYDLFAVVNHNGRIDSGHYTALIRKKGVWFKCDDDKVTMLPAAEDVIRSEEAYLVFYVQRYPNVQFFKS